MKKFTLLGIIGASIQLLISSYYAVQNQIDILQLLDNNSVMLRNIYTIINLMDMLSNTMILLFFVGLYSRQKA